MHILLPGRHHLLTRFQLDYLTRGCSGQLLDLNGEAFDEEIDSIVWAVTSANHSNTRRNPLPAHRREAAIERATVDLPVNSHVHLIPDVGETPRFASYTLKAIEVSSDGRFSLNPDNAILACSTPTVIGMYLALGFRVLPMELADMAESSFHTRTPWQLINRLVELGNDWRDDEALMAEISPASLSIFLRYGHGDRIVALHQSDLLTDDGNLTETRDYNVYVRAFDEGAERKFALVRDFIVPGRIVDVGCCTGAILREMSCEDRLHESDLFGVEVSRQLYAECQHRKHQGAFGNDHVFFYQRDFASGRIFPRDSINTFTTFSLTHEIASYGGETLAEGKNVLKEFIELLASQLAIGGRWINLDVVGPEQGDQTIWLWLNDEDGDDVSDAVPKEGSRDELRDGLAGLSTLGRFRRFASEFRHDYGESIEHEIRQRDGRTYARLRLDDACEFISKMDYLDNWQSEMHERFCFWSFTDWRAAVEAAGLKVVAGSHAFANPWILENRYRGKVAFFQDSEGALVEQPFPVTNMLMVAERS